MIMLKIISKQAQDNENEHDLTMQNIFEEK
jgi:hypothetical protein